MLELTVHTNASRSLESYLRERLRYAERGAVERALRNRDVKRNGARLGRGETVAEGDILQVYIADDLLYPEPRVLLSRDGLLAIDKPQDIPSVGEGSIEEWMQGRYPGARACHRLDSATCGVLLFALSDDVHDEVLRLFKERKVGKTYRCRVAGLPRRTEGELCAYLRKDGDRGKVYASRQMEAGARSAVLRYRVIGTDGETALLEVDLLTGRTHQIRVQMAHEGHPVLGDDLYGDRAINRALRARKLHLQSMRLSLREGRFAGVVIEAPPIGFLRTEQEKETIPYGGI